MASINPIEFVFGIIGIIIAIPPSIQAGMYIWKQLRERRKEKGH